MTWERQRRSIELASAFQAKLIMIEKENCSRMARYLHCVLITTKLLIQDRPECVFAQNPSLVLALQLCLLKKIFGYKLIVDRHSNFRFGKQSGLATWIFHKISDYTIKKADFTIVTNQYLKNMIDAKGGCGIVLQDKLPELSKGKYEKLKGDTNIVYVSSFSYDEPIDEVINAFEELDGSCHLYITGNYKKSKKYYDINKCESNNIHFTGYLSEESYQSLLLSTDIIMVLTVNEHTLTCGAYEGLSLGKPMILSNTKAIKEYFTDGVLYCEPKSKSIRTNLEICIKKKNDFKRDILYLRDRTEANWKDAFNACKNVISV